MSDKLDEYVDGVFAPYEGAKSISELKADLLADLHERFRELKAEGKDDAAAFELTIDSIGDIEQTVQEVSNLSRSLERQLVTRFDMSELSGKRLRGRRGAGRKVRDEHAARLRFLARRSHRQLIQDERGGGRQLRRRRSDRCEHVDDDLTRASFRGSILVRTDFSMSGLTETRFADAALVDVKFRTTDLRRTVFEHCAFTGVDFTHSDLRGLNLDGATFTSVKFEKAALERCHVPGRDAAGRVLPHLGLEVPQCHPHRGLRWGANGQADLRRAQGSRGGPVQRDR
jgi:uncharacterized protein YjbI with pentapeptide repeats